jgi:hypothetical protein
LTVGVVLYATASTRVKVASNLTVAPPVRPPKLRYQSVVGRIEEAFFQAAMLIPAPAVIRYDEKDRDI